MHPTILGCMFQGTGTYVHMEQTGYHTALVNMRICRIRDDRMGASVDTYDVLEVCGDCERKQVQVSVSKHQGT